MDITRKAPVLEADVPPQSASGATSQSTDEEALKQTDASTSPASTPFKADFRLYMILVSLGLAALLVGIETTIAGTALPTIVRELGGADSYIWAVNGYLLAICSLQPLYGQICDLFGRRWPIIVASAIFMLGSGICGGATNMSMLIAGRVVQGIGGSGINLIIEIVICDVVPLRERGKYMGLVFGIVTLGTALGPFFGGLIVDFSTWRWVFYLNLPVGGAAVLMLWMFLRVRYDRETGLARRLARLDWAGNIIFVAAVSSVLVALAWAGAVYSWSSFRVIVPLVLGMLGLAAFLVFEAFPAVAPVPTMPLRILSNRTTIIVLALTFLHSVSTAWVQYFLPVYFQGVLGYTPSYSGVAFLPSILTILPFAGAGGVLLSKVNRYREIHAIGFAFMTIAFGLFVLLDENSTKGLWVGVQILWSAGAGLLVPTLLPALLAPLKDSDTAAATATWGFVRTFGFTWGAAIPAAVFNNRFDVNSGQIDDKEVVAKMLGGRAYEHATAVFLDSLEGETRRQVVRVFADSLRTTWAVAIAFAGLATFLVWIAREVPLRSELETTEFGMEEKKKVTPELKA